MNTETDSKTLDAKNDGEIDCIRKMRDVDNLDKYPRWIFYNSRINGLMRITFLRMKRIYSILMQLVFQQEELDPEIFCENKLDYTMLPKGYGQYFPFKAVY